MGAQGQRWMLRITGPLLMLGAVVTLALGWKPAQAQTAPAVTAANDGAHAFDFLIGDWHIVNRKRLVLLKNEDRWETFEAESHARPLPHGIGNVDDFTSPTWRPGYIGMTIRIYSPQTKRWSLFWLNNRTGGLDANGQFEPPVVGRFVGNEGVFEGDDTYDGRPIRVRYLWRRIDADHAHWEQAFSPDGGRTWEVNWTMESSRTARVSTPAPRP